MPGTSAFPVRALAIVLAGVLVSAGLVGAFRLGQASQPLALSTSEESETAVPAEVLPLAQLYQRLSDEAVSAPEGEALVEAAIEGMLESLDDPYATYYDADAFAAFNELIEGSFSGVGLMLEDTPEGATIIRVLPGTPAEEAGVEQGERIVSVDGRDVGDAPIDTIVNLVKGEAGTSVTLGLDGGSEGQREVELQRAEIELPTVTAELLDDGIAHLEVLSFTRGVADSVRTQLEQLIEQGARGVVLDLRGNPGGLLREAVDVTSVFAEEGVVVGVKEREGELDEISVSGEALTDAPLVVLVDETSASASEIVAGAVQDLDRGTVVGTNTFGKGTVQTVRMLEGGLGVKFTTAEYFTPSGDSIEEVGVTPDREVADAEEQLQVAQEILAAQLAGVPAGR